MEIRFFRLLLVLVAMILTCTLGAWAVLADQERDSARAMATSFDEYNRYIDVCEGQSDSNAWDLAVEARDVLQRTSAEHDSLGRKMRLLVWMGLGACAGLTVCFYAFRWAITGRVRPVWLL